MEDADYQSIPSIHNPLITSQLLEWKEEPETEPQLQENQVVIDNAEKSSGKNGAIHVLHVDDDPSILVTFRSHLEDGRRFRN